ncbi:MAG: hypothetical protein ACHQ2F_02255 [Desulfobaccales bacterium]
MLKINLALMLIGLCLVVGLAVAEAQQPGAASASTKKHNAELLQQLPFTDQQDFEDAKRGFIAPLPDGGVIRNQAGKPVWDLGGFSFIRKGPPRPRPSTPASGASRSS